MDRRSEEEITAFVKASYSRLVRLAYLLCGDSGRSEDLVQTALMKTILVWERLRWDDGVDHYVQRVLVNSFISAQRRRSWWERPSVRAARVHERAADQFEAVNQRDTLWRALARLPARQRAAVILRHYEDLSERHTAAVMGCSVGTVKALSSRGLQSLRRALADSQTGERAEEEAEAVSGAR